MRDRSACSQRRRRAPALERGACARGRHDGCAAPIAGLDEHPAFLRRDLDALVSEEHVEPRTDGPGAAERRLDDKRPRCILRDDEERFTVEHADRALAASQAHFERRARVQRDLAAILEREDALFAG
jgi:hypothetical protein